MKNSNLKLFLWEDVLVDYSEGVIFIIAESKEQAIELLILKQMERDAEVYKLFTEQARREFAEKEAEVREALNKEPRVIEDEFVFTLWGGG